MTPDDSAAHPLEQLLEEQVQTLLTGATPGAVVGVGVDVVEIVEFAALPFAANKPFYELAFTADEISYCLSYAAPARHFAARFAAKEAVVKACGSVAHISPAQVEIEHMVTGAPHAKIHATPALDSAFTIHVSMGHSEALAYAVALVVHAPS